MKATEVQKIHTCPCGKKDTKDVRRVRRSIMVQLAGMGYKERPRAKAVTVHCCESCVLNITQARGKALRWALADAVRTAAMDLKTKELANGGN